MKKNLQQLRGILASLFVPFLIIGAILYLFTGKIAPQIIIVFTIFLVLLIFLPKQDEK